MTPGSKYGRYQILRPLGRGAMGDVYLALDTEMGAQVALKIVYKGSDAEDAEIVNAERLGAELQRQVAPADPRVCRVHRYGDLDGAFYIEMEYVDGDDLSTVVARSPLAPGMAVRVGIELCEMLENLKVFTASIDGKQFHGIIHGDLKPKNVRLTRQNQVKVLDFGIAKALSYTHKHTTNLFASSAYCSPERLESQRMDAASDLWSVGVLLYQMLSGRLPFDETNRMRLEHRILSYAPPDPLPLTVPEPLRRILAKTLARNPEFRYATAAALRDDLDRFARGVPVLAQTPEMDSDATMRSGTATGGAGGERTARSGYDERTMRTGGRPMPAPPASRAMPVQQRSSFAMGCLAVMGVLLAIAAGFTLLQVSAWNSADALKSDIKTGKVSAAAAFDRYQKLNQRSHLPGTMFGVRNALKHELSRVADDPIREYRESDAPYITLAQWTQARDALTKALEVDPDDREIQGRLQLVGAHIDRINAGGQRPAQRSRLLSSAMAKFETAEELLHHSPDPYLGLARLYVYDLNDVDRAEDSIRKAADYGHPVGRRERAQLADGYRHRADRTWRDSRAYTQMPDQEKDYLSHAREDYIHARDLYQEAGLFGDAPRNEMQAMQSEQRVEERLAQLDGSAHVKEQ